MPTHITNDDTVKIAGLIKLHLQEEEVSRYTSQLNTVLDAVEILKEVDTDNIVETSQTHGLTNVLAEDIAQPGLDISEYPNRKNLKSSYFVVEKVL